MAESLKKTGGSYSDIGLWTGKTIFNREIMVVLQNTARDLFNCLITILPEPSVYALKEYQIDITEDLHRSLYIVNDNTVLIIAGVLHKEKIIAGIGLVLRKPFIVQLEAVISTFASALTSQLTDIYISRGKNALQLLGDDLIKLTIARHLASRYFEVSNIIYLIDVFNKLRTTSYEGHYFSTGMILTGAIDEFTERDNHRQGGTLSLLHSVGILRKGSINRRFWYLADGKRSFYVANKEFQIVSLFNLDEQTKEYNYIDSLTLSHTITDTDIMIKVDNEKELSIVTSNQQEFIYTENKWSIRDYNYFILLLHKFLGMETALIESLLFFVLYCSKNGISSIIWIPEEMKDTKKLLKSRNRSFRRAILINEDRHRNLIMRLLSSDGVTIIDKQGYLQYYGCIVDLTKARVRGAKGTGESAAKLLTRNGGAIKVSRDGSITLHLPHYSPSILF